MTKPDKFIGKGDRRKVMIHDSGFTTKMSEWKEKTGFSDVDYIRHLEAALRCACDRIADTPGQDFEKIRCEDDWFDFFLYEADHTKNIEK